jgi:hypothetical protein
MRLLQRIIRNSKHARRSHCSNMKKKKKKKMMKKKKKKKKKN